MRPSLCITGGGCTDLSLFGVSLELSGYDIRSGASVGSGQENEGREHIGDLAVAFFASFFCTVF